MLKGNKTAKQLTLPTRVRRVAAVTAFWLFESPPEIMNGKWAFKNGFKESVVCAFQQ
jgi:hypothetical protein